MAVPLYLYTGPELGEKKEKILTLKEALKKKYGSSDDFSYYAADMQMNEVVAQLMTESLFTPASFVVINNAELIKDKKDTDLLSQWVESAKKTGSDATVLVLTSEEFKVDVKLEKLVPPSNKVVFWEMFEDRKEQWLHSFFQKNGYSIDTDAVEAVLEMVENNTEELKSECSRFFMCFPKGHCVTAAEVEQILSHNREESAFTLFDAMMENAPAQKKFENCLSILQKIRMLKKDNDHFVIIGGLLYCFRKLALWHSLNAAGRADELELKKNGFASATVRKQYAQASKIWTPGQVQAVISLLSKTDMEIRSSGMTFQDTQLILMIYEIVIKKGAYCSVYDDFSV
jgi:DNA polymerase-3 subunit delta